jgi:hypothetical protein
LKSKSRSKSHESHSSSDTESIKLASSQLKLLKEQLSSFSNPNSQLDQTKKLQRSRSASLTSSLSSSKSRKRKSLHLLPPLQLSSTYTLEKEAFDREVKYKKLKAKCRDLKSELDSSHHLLRLERKKTLDLTSLATTLKKKLAHAQQ